MTPDWTTLEKLDQVPVWIARTRALHHQHFSTIGAAVGAFPVLGGPAGATPGTAREYAGVLAMTRAFLDAHVRGDTTFRGGRAWNGLVASRLPPH